jgi:hypothetical protein
MYARVGRSIASLVLERFAIESLDDNDLRVASAALDYLRDHGSAGTISGAAELPN